MFHICTTFSNRQIFKVICQLYHRPVCNTDDIIGRRKLAIVAWVTHIFDLHVACFLCDNEKADDIYMGFKLMINIVRTFCGFDGSNRSHGSGLLVLFKLFFFKSHVIQKH